MYRVKDLLKNHGSSLDLELCVGEPGLDRRIRVPECQRPGISLAGYLRHHSFKRILILGKVEIHYLKDLDRKTRIKRLQDLITDETPCVIVTRRYRPPQELIELCRDRNVSLFRSSMVTMKLMAMLVRFLDEEFAPSVNTHGTFIEVFGVGVLIRGDSSVGKSEAALGLIERGHRLISDDVVQIRKRENAYLEGFGVDITRHHMEIRGIGIINVAHLYGAVCVRNSKTVDLVAELEEWDENHFYDRVGLELKTTEILGIDVPHHVVPVKPGRDVVLLIETLALNHRLKGMGYHSARDFNRNLIARINGTPVGEAMA